MTRGTAAAAVLRFLGISSFLKVPEKREETPLQLRSSLRPRGSVGEEMGRRKLVIMVLAEKFLCQILRPLPLKFLRKFNS